MKISGAGRSSGPSTSRRSGKVSSAGNSGFADHLRPASSADADEELSGLDGSAALTGLESLLAVQAVDADEGGGRGKRRMMQRGEELLDRLEDIRRGLLMGTIPESRLMQLSQLVKSKREAGADPQLSAILDEIELRAEVELAKLEQR